MAVIVNTAVMHVLDFAQNRTSLSEESLNLEDSLTESYVEKTIRHAQSDANGQKGSFEEDAEGLSLLQKYMNHEINFTDLSILWTQSFLEDLKAASSDPLTLLFADYREDEAPYLAVLVLLNRPVYTVMTGMDGDRLSNSVVFGNSVLPEPSRRLHAYALINEADQSIVFADDMNIMKDIILHCSAGRSGKVVLQSVQSITSEIAEEFDENPAVLFSEVKNCIRADAEEEKPVTTEDLAVKVFNHSDEMQNRFLSRSKEEELPEEIELPQKFMERKLKTQRIRTDTGISISFPSEFASDPSRIRFITNDDGTMTIELHHIGHITNRS